MAGGASSALTFRLAREREAAFIEACRESRERLGWSQRELARQLEVVGLNLPQSSIAKLERGTEDRRPLTLSEAVVLSATLRVSLLPYVAPGLSPDTSAAVVQLADRLDAWLEYVIEMDGIINEAKTAHETLRRSVFDADGRLQEWAMDQLGPARRAPGSQVTDG